MQKWFLLEILIWDLLLVESLLVCASYFNPNPVTWSLFCLCEFLLFFLGLKSSTKNSGKIWLLFFLYEDWYFVKKNFFRFFLKVPKKAPGNRITNFLNMNQCIIKYQNCQKRLQVNWLIIKVPKKAPGNRITNFLRVTRLGLINSNSYISITKR